MGAALRRAAAATRSYMRGRAASLRQGAQTRQMLRNSGGGNSGGGAGGSGG